MTNDRSPSEGTLRARLDDWLASERYDRAEIVDLMADALAALAQGAQAQEDSDWLRHGHIIEIAVRNMSGSVSEYMHHWEGRALKAEQAVQALTAERDKLETILGIEKRAYERLNLCPDHRDKTGEWCIVCRAEERTKAELRAAAVASGATPPEDPLCMCEHPQSYHKDLGAGYFGCKNARCDCTKFRPLKAVEIVDAYAAARRIQMAPSSRLQLIDFVEYQLARAVASGAKKK